MFNQDFGIINSYTGLNVDWLGNPCGGQGRDPAHQPLAGLPLHVHRLHGRAAVDPAATCARRPRIDGANAFRMLRSIIMPLLLVAVGPLLLASFAFNFNNFTLIFLLTKGGPFDGATPRSARATCSSPTPTAWPSAAPRPNYGFAAAVSVFIFIIVALLSYPGIPSDQVPGGGQLMSEVYQRQSVADPARGRGRGRRCHAPPAASPAGVRGRGTWWRHGLAIVALIWSLFPIVFIVLGGAEPRRLARDQPACCPTSASLANFQAPLHRRGAAVLSWYKNSLLIAGVGSLCSVFIGACAAFAFSRLRFMVAGRGC